MRNPRINKCMYKKQVFIHTDTEAQMLKETSSGFLCRQAGRDAVRWKATVTDEKSLASFLSPSPSSSSHSFLPSSSSLHFHAFSLLLLLSLLLIWSLLCASLCFIFLLLSPYLVLLCILFYSSLLYSQRGNWNPFLQSICCRTNGCTSALFFLSFPPFLLLFHPCTLQTYPTPHPFTHTHTHKHKHTYKYFFHSCPVSRLRNSQCIVGLSGCMHPCVCVCVCVCVSVCVQCELVCRDDIAK